MECPTMVRFGVATLASLLLVFTASCVGGGGGGGFGAALPTNSTSAVIGPEGGEIELGDARLVVPKGALQAEQTFEMGQYDTFQIDGYSLKSPVFEIKPHGQQFEVPATLTIANAAGGEVEFLRADNMHATFGPVQGAQVGDGQATAQLSGLSAFTLAQAAMDPVGQPSGGTFEVDGDVYSPSPVTNGDIAGLGYSYTEAAGVIDHGPDGGSGHVWYGDDNCVTFRVDGTGWVDTKGGRDDSSNSFPYVHVGGPPNGDHPPRVNFYPGTPLSRHLKPGYNRSDDLWHFRWGVRLDTDGNVYEGFGGRHEYYLLFSDDNAPLNSGTHDFTPGDGPEIYGVFDYLSLESPSGHHFCHFYEKRSQVVGDDGLLCRERVLTSVTGQPTEHACYARGMLQGSYTLTTETGAEVVRGNFKDNRPVDGWSSYDEQGNRLGGGKFDENGARFGEWEVFRDGRPAKRFNVSGTIVETEFGYHQELDGAYTSYFADVAGAPVHEDGKYTDSHKDGAWNIYDRDGKLQEQIRYDADNQIASGSSQCITDDEGQEHCVDRTRSARVQKIVYDWGECFSGKNYMVIIDYDNADEAIERNCFEIEGSYSEPKKGASTTCPSVCSA